jgi:hypothetical protein
MFPSNKAQEDLLSQCEIDDGEFNVWIRGADRSFDVALSPLAYNRYVSMLNEKGIRHQVLHHDIQSIFDEEQESMTATKSQ